jgi:hypothetical protein
LNIKKILVSALSMIIACVANHLRGHLCRIRCILTV